MKTAEGLRHFAVPVAGLLLLGCSTEATSSKSPSGSGGFPGSAGSGDGETIGVGGTIDAGRTMGVGGTSGVGGRIGSNGGSGWGGSAGGSALDGGMGPVTPSAGNPFAAAGVWTGYFDASSPFFSGSNAVTLMVSVAADQTTSAQLSMGAPTTLPVPTDPDVGWPPNLTRDNASRVILPALEGFSYEARNVRWEEGRLKFTISIWSPWQAWCQLQQRVFPSSHAPTGYACVPEGFLKQDDSGNCYIAQTSAAVAGTPVDCAKGFPLCIGTPAICACDAAACSAVDLPPRSFDLVLGDGVGEGTAAQLIGTTSTRIHLTQVEKP